MNIFKRVSRWIDSFIGNNAGHNPADDMFNRDMWDYYSGNAVPCNDSERKQGSIETFRQLYGSSLVDINCTEPELKVLVAADDPEYIRATGTARTAGHLSCQGGLRGHSVGDVFPYVPYFKGVDGKQVWVHCPNGEQLGPFDSQEQMYDALNFLGVYREQEDNRGV